MHHDSTRAQRAATIIRSPGATALGLLCAAMTLRVLLAGVSSLEQITTSHMLTVTVLAITIAGGHMLFPLVTRLRLLPALGLAVLLAASTVYLVTASAGRNAAAQADKAAKVRVANEARARADEELSDAHARLEAAQRQADDARRAADKECASGKGRRCDGQRTTAADAAATVTDRESRVRLAEATLALLPPPQVEQAELRYAARVFATLPYVTADEAVIFARLDLWLPFALTLILELGTVVFFGIGFAHGSASALPKPSPAAAAVEGRDHPAPSDSAQTSMPVAEASGADFVALAALVRPDSERPDGPSDGPARRPDGPPRGPRHGPNGPAQRAPSPAIERLLADIRSGRTFDSQAEIVRHYGIPRSTLSDQLAQLEAAGAIPRRRTVGRCKVVEPA